MDIVLVAAVGRPRGAAVDNLLGRDKLQGSPELSLAVDKVLLEDKVLLKDKVRLDEHPLFLRSKDRSCVLLIIANS